MKVLVHDGFHFVGVFEKFVVGVERFELPVDLALQRFVARYQAEHDDVVKILPPHPVKPLVEVRTDANLEAASLFTQDEVEMHTPLPAQCHCVWVPIEGDP
jgi:hypothetical protein